MSALQHYFDSERLRRGWSMRDVAKRSAISLSKAYAIVKGDDNVEFETFENIATAFDMTPAELAVVIGKGSAEHDPKETRLISVYRRVPEHKRAAAEEMLEGLAAANASETGTANHSGVRLNRGGRKAAAADKISESWGLVLARSTAVLAWICRPLHPLGVPTAAIA